MVRPYIMDGIIKININNELQENRMILNWEIHLNSRGIIVKFDLIPEDYFDIIIEAKDDENKLILDDRDNLKMYQIIF